MAPLRDMFHKPYPPESKTEVNAILQELVEIGKREDFLSEHPGGAFNIKCRHIRTRELGTRLNEIGGFALMEYACNQIRKKLSTSLADHLEYAWSEIGEWMS